MTSGSLIRGTFLILVMVSAYSSRVESQPAPVSTSTAISLFDGKSLTGWTKRDGAEHDGWTADEESLFRKSGGGDLYYKNSFRDFVLYFQWRIEEGGNSGLKYRVREYEGHGWLGCEYQILDDSVAPDANKSAGLYDVFDPSSHKPIVRPGEWNHGKIVVCAGHIEHWLNGVMTVQATVGDPRWRSAVAESKFSGIPGFGENREGRIFLQDHGDPVWFRNLVLIPLDCAEYWPDPWGYYPPRCNRRVYRGWTWSLPPCCR